MEDTRLHHEDHVLTLTRSLPPAPKPTKLAAMERYNLRNGAGTVPGVNLGDIIFIHEVFRGRQAGYDRSLSPKFSVEMLCASLGGLADPGEEDEVEQGKPEAKKRKGEGGVKRQQAWRR